MKSIQKRANFVCKDHKEVKNTMYFRNSKKVSIATTAEENDCHYMK